ncbi:hypothetical protein V6N12_002013 [Hibiscus sabdariffa]|uniref:S-locus receptor kinase C-terminal domain-containing protein n=1 Tax=Hibiscus sabdariffa TaxID=183260 RepID=A0ABR2B5X2_9ROSI
MLSVELAVLTALVGHYATAHNINPITNVVTEAWRLLKQNKTFEFIDTALGNSYDSAQVIRCYKIALLCVQDNPRDRPYMSEVVFLLHNDSELPEPNMPRYLARTTSRISTSRNGPISICEPTSMTIYGR